MNMNILKAFLRRQREKTLKTEVEHLRERFSVEDRNGRIWLTYDGTAFAVMDANATMADTIDMIEGCRRAAIAHRYHLTVSDDAEIDAVTILETSLN